MSRGVWNQSRSLIVYIMSLFCCNSFLVRNKSRSLVRCTYHESLGIPIISGPEWIQYNRTRPYSSDLVKLLTNNSCHLCKVHHPEWFLCVDPDLNMTTQLFLGVVAFAWLQARSHLWSLNPVLSWGQCICMFAIPQGLLLTVWNFNYSATQAMNRTTSGNIDFASLISE
jgi:hypothetical protein